MKVDIKKLITCIALPLVVGGVADFCSLFKWRGCIRKFVVYTGALF